MDMLKKYGPWVFVVLPALAFVAAGGAKVAGVEAAHLSFQTMGLPSWFGYFIGACEVAGAIGLFITGLRKLAAAGLAVVMVGAIYFHIAYAVPSAVPALILLAMMIFVMVWNWKSNTQLSA